jgi:predicted deacetylase
MEATQQMLADLEKWGVKAVSLLVIPNHHHRGHFLDNPEFCAWLRQRVDKGDEVVIHGYYHRRDRHEFETFRDKVVTRFYTADEGEFYDILGADAIRLVQTAREDFAKLKMHPRGFIAPAWLLSEGGERALQLLGIQYTTRLKTLHDLSTGETWETQSLVWSVRKAWRRITSLRWNALLYRRLRDKPVMRMSLHPPDVRYRSIWRQVQRLVTQALADRESLTYQQWIETSRKPANAVQSRPPHPFPL